MNENQNNEIEKLLQDAAEKITPNVMFAGRLEKELKQAHTPRKPIQFPRFKQVLAVFAPAVALVVFVILVVLVIQKMQSNHKIAAPGIPTQIGTAAPAPSIPTAIGTAQPAPNLPSYDRNGVTVYLGAEFPQTPANLKVYTVRKEEMATSDMVRALAEQFKMTGAIYELTGQQGTSGLLGSNTEYLVVDGNRQLRVRSDRYFAYYPDYVSWSSNVAGAAPANAEELAKQFMKDFGFESGYGLEKQGLNLYAALALSPDGFGVRNDDFQVNGLQIQFNQDGVSLVNGSILRYDESATVSVISAEDAFQKLFVTPADFSLPAGYMEGRHGGGYYMVDDKVIKPEDVKAWTHIRPLDTPLTYNGWMSATDQSIDGGAPLILLDGYTVTGNVQDIPAGMVSTYVEARGQFHAVNGVKTFEIESWKQSEGNDASIKGVVKRAGDQVVFDSIDGQHYILQDVPANIPLPLDPAFVMGISRGDIFDWKTINNIGGGGGGGGGGGNAFYKVNLTGKPVPFPTPLPLSTPTTTPSQQTASGLRGTLMINIFAQPDGTQVKNYLFLPYEGDDQGATLLLQGNIDAALDAYHNRPIDVWGKIGGMEKGQTVLTVDRYEIPYPNLKFQLLTGTQENKTIDGQDVALITASDGVTYIALSPNGPPLAMQVASPGKGPVPPPDSPTPPTPVFSDKMQIEALIIPGESLLGYPGLRMFNSVPETVDGTPVPMSISSDKPNIYPGSPPPSAMTVEKIELVYFTHDQRWQKYDPAYLQPMWRFTGHYDDGTEFEFFVQALKQEFLLPEPEDQPLPPG